MKKLQYIVYLSTILLTLPSLMALVTAPLIPVEVEKEQGYYYFKIHGVPGTATETWLGTRYGYAYVTYKNLDSVPQTVTISITYYWSFPEPSWRSDTRTKTVMPGDPWQYDINADCGKIVSFDLTIESNSEIGDGEIIIPPPPN